MPHTTVQCDTPALLLEMDVAERNIARMADYFRGKKAALRPHVKVHKSPLLAHKQIDAGAKGITCAKLSEAEVMAQAGIEDILIANEIVGDEKLARLAGLARACRITVAVDNRENVRLLSKWALRENSRIGVLVDLNLYAATGIAGILDRCGVRSSTEAVELARETARLKGLEFRGLMGYEGSLRKFADFQSRRDAARKVLGQLVEARELIEDSGLCVDTVSCGGTMSYKIAGEFQGVTEVQAGSYVFMDTTYHQFGIDFETSLTVLTSVISAPRPEKLVVDGGLKAISTDHGLPKVRGRDDLEVTALNAEHGHIHVGSQGKPAGIGDRLELLPTHADTTVCLHDCYIVARGGQFEAALEIPCRGKLQ